jgi:exodeoxyribonuclease V alpha subunit
MTDLFDPEPPTQTEPADPLATQLCELFARLNPAAPEVLFKRVAALVAANRSGHVCLPLPPSERERLRASALVAWPGGYAPLVLDQAGRLYFARHWFAEARIAQRLAALAADNSQAAPEQVKAWLDTLFADAGPESRQRLAAALAARKRFLLIAGGPGTGKTTTVVRLLALLAALSARPLVMAMAAPTGKAAARLTESVRTARERLPLSEAEKARLPERAQTLHRLLGLKPGSGRARHHAGAPLPLDVLVIDEGSMVDLALMDATLDALPPHARLILLGDPDQLASVEAGSVLTDLAELESWRADTAAWLAAAGSAVPASASNGGPLADAVVRLTHSHRFDANSGIGALAQAVNRGDAAGASALLQDGRHADLAWRAGSAGLAEMLLAERASYFEQVTQAEPQPEALFHAFNRLMLLCGERRQVETFNAGVERLLEARGLKPRGSDWYAGRPVMVRENDYSVGLFNGDIGLALPTPDGLRVLFPAPDGGFRRFAPARLPAHDSVYAMTVHKSQGSEFDSVWLALPDSPGANLSRALIYTAITRARKQFTLAGSLALLEAAVRQREQRASGLADRLAEFSRQHPL